VASRFASASSISKLNAYVAAGLSAGACTPGAPLLGAAPEASATTASAPKSDLVNETGKGRYPQSETRSSL